MLDRVPDEPRISGNDWGVLRPPPLGTWTPTLTVSVVIPAYGGHEKLALTLASLTRQTYPAELLEVVVVDDGSDPPLGLPEFALPRWRIVRPPDHGWGPGHARAHGASVATGDILHWVDADMVLDRTHIEAQARWHHLLSYAVTLGDRRCVAHWEHLRVDDVLDDGRLDEFFAEDAEPEWTEDLYDRTDRLRGADHTAFRAHVTQTAAVRRSLYDRAGGFDPELQLGEDTEFGYRAAQAGAVFIPDPEARSRHLGRTAQRRRRAELRRHNLPSMAARMPLPPWFRGDAPGRSWPVPLLVAVVAAGAAPETAETIDNVLAQERDLAVLVAGADDEVVRDGRARYGADPRVTFVAERPESAFPSPYLLELSAGDGLEPGTLRRLLTAAHTTGAGLVEHRAVRLWRTAALSRARLLEASGSVESLVGRTFGRTVVR